MGKKCDIARDLMPMCIDGTASQSARKYVDNHIKECKPCKAVYVEMKSAVVIEPPKEDLTFADAVTTLQSRRKRRTWRGVLIGMALALAVVAVLFGGYYWYFVDEVRVIPSPKSEHTFYQNLGGNGVGTVFLCTTGIPDGAKMQIEVNPNDYDGDGVPRYEAYISYWTTRAEMNNPESKARYLLGTMDMGCLYMSNEKGERAHIEQIISGTCKQGGQIIYQEGRRMLFGDMFGITVRTPDRIYWNGTELSNRYFIQTGGTASSEGVAFYTPPTPATDGE